MPAIQELSPPAAATKSPTVDFIPIAHQREPDDNIKKTNKTTKNQPPSPSVVTDFEDDDDNDDDDGFTPITPAASSPKKSRGFRTSRTPPLPRDALGIPVSKYMFGRDKKANSEDLEPLSPSAARGLYDNELPEPAVQQQQKTKRRTVWGMLEGWWDLGLLERGKSLRKGVKGIGIGRGM